MTNKPVIGVDIGGTLIRAGRIESESIIKHASSKITSSGTVDQTITEIIETIEKVHDSSIEAIGVGVPSLVDSESGIVYNAENIPSWKEVRLKEFLQSHFRKPVYINNDANCFALGEKYISKGQPFRNMVGITIGTGLGVGIIINNKPLFWRELWCR